MSGLFCVLAGPPLREKSGRLLVLALGCTDWFVYRFEVILVYGWVSFVGLEETQRSVSDRDAKVCMCMACHHVA